MCEHALQSIKPCTTVGINTVIRFQVQFWAPEQQVGSGSFVQFIGHLNDTDWAWVQCLSPHLVSPSELNPEWILREPWVNPGVRSERCLVWFPNQDKTEHLNTSLIAFTPSKLFFNILARKRVFNLQWDDKLKTLNYTSLKDPLDFQARKQYYKNTFYELETERREIEYS